MYTHHFKKKDFLKINDIFNFFFQRGPLLEISKNIFKNLIFFKRLTTRHRVQPKYWWSVKRRRKKKYFYRKENIRINNLCGGPNEDFNNLDNVFLKNKLLNFSIFFKKLFQKTTQYQVDPLPQVRLQFFDIKLFSFYKLFFKNFSIFGGTFFLKKLSNSRLNNLNSQLYFTDLLPHIHTLSFIFFDELLYSKFRKNFTNYYIYRTFEHAYHTYWVGHSYNTVMCYFETHISSTKYLSEDVESSFFGDFTYWHNFLFHKIQVAGLGEDLEAFLRIKHKRLFRRFKRYAKKNLRRTKIEQLSYFFNIFLGSTQSFEDFYENGVDSFIQSFQLNNFDSFLNETHHFLSDNLPHNELLPTLNWGGAVLENFELSKQSTLTLKLEFINSNYMPIFYLSDHIKYIILAQEKLIEEPTDHRYLQQYLVNFISHYSNMKSLYILQSNLNNLGARAVFSFKEGVNAIAHYFTKVHSKFFKNFDLADFVEIFTYTLIQKDLNYFVQFFKKNMEEMSFKKHKKILYSFEFLIKKFMNKFFNCAGVFGFKFEISGKISVTGNSKTRNKIIKWGRYSLTNKSLKIDYARDVIRTTTGVMGFRMFITY
jgi:hypothetical protein